MKLYIFPLIGIVFKNTVFCFSDNYVYEDALSKPHFQIYFSDQILNNNEIDVLVNIYFYIYLYSYYIIMLNLLLLLLLLFFFNCIYNYMYI